MAFSFIKKPLWKHVFYNTIFKTDPLNKVRAKLNNITKSFEMTLNSETWNRKTKN